MSGYLVHHGYVSAAQSFARWSSLSMSPSTDQSVSAGTMPPIKPQDFPLPPPSPLCKRTAGLSTQHSDIHLSSAASAATTSTPESPLTAILPRRHSDSSCVTSANHAPPQFPGLASMLHRRRLRALCRRCQYGRAATALKNLYPQVLERCPELLVQLRCRQLIEMVSGVIWHYPPLTVIVTGLSFGLDRGFSGCNVFAELDFCMIVVYISASSIFLYSSLLRVILLIYRSDMFIIIIRKKIKPYTYTLILFVVA